MDYNELARLLAAHGQEHVLAFWDELSAAERETLSRQVEAIDWDTLALFSRPEDLSGGKIEPIPMLSAEEIARDSKIYRKAGREGIVAGKLGAVLLAGGQGTRLGSSGPKGAYDIGITRPLYIFEQLIENLLAVCRDCGATVPLFVMTSEKNDNETRAFFRAHGNFGYPAEFLRFFKQDMAASVDFSGKLLLESKGSLALSPNGNGGWFSSLLKAGILADFPAVEWLNVFAVDNVLQRIADPVFFGATLLSGKNCGAKGVRKAYPEEKVGVLCLKDGLPTVVEYYEMTEENNNRRDRNGNLLYSCGVILNYLFRLEKLRGVAGKKIPVHVVKKKIPHIDGAGRLVSPEEPNGYKFETLILDMVRLMESCLPCEAVREREFAPIKNKTGIDSVESARELLKRNGVEL